MCSGTPHLSSWFDLKNAFKRRFDLRPRNSRFPALNLNFQKTFSVDLCKPLQSVNLTRTQFQELMPARMKCHSGTPPVSPLVNAHLGAETIFSQFSPWQLWIWKWNNRYVCNGSTLVTHLDGLCTTCVGSLQRIDLKLSPDATVAYLYYWACHIRACAENIAEVIHCQQNACSAILGLRGNMGKFLRSGPVIQGDINLLLSAASQEVHYSRHHWF